MPAVQNRPLSNAEIARHLSSAAQLLAAKGENPFKVRAYRRAAETIAGLPNSVEVAVRAGEDLTRYPGVGKGIAGAVREIVTSGKMGQMEMLLTAVPPELLAIQEYPRLDPKRVLRAYKKLGIRTVAELKSALSSGALAEKLGQTMAGHFRAAFAETAEILLYDADPLVESLRRYLLKQGGAERAEAAGAFRRRVEVISKIVFVTATSDFPKLVERFARYGGGTEVISASAKDAQFRLSNGLHMELSVASAAEWGLALIRATGSTDHVDQLEQRTGPLSRFARKRLPDEEAVYRAVGLAWIPPELREGRDEIGLAAQGIVPRLVEVRAIRGELHAHTTASDGRHTMEEMAQAAAARGYSYLGITDHSQSLKIARGVTEADLWKQIKAIDRLNSRLKGIRLLKSAEVDILADGSLDYSDAILAELDYTICSIHSRFRLSKREQTTRLCRAMDHPAFNILGHATGRLLLRRPGYEIDFERVLSHASARGCFFEINASPDRLDLSAAQARRAAEAGVLIAVNTDAHAIDELDYVRCGIDVARRAGLGDRDLLNTRNAPELLKALAR
jgi:DNA polymerase (family 10)